MARGQVPTADPDGRAGVVEQLYLPGRRVRLVKSIESIPLPEGGSLRAVRKAPLGPARGVVVCFHGFGQNRYTFHLPERSLTGYLTAHGFVTWNVDLRGHGRSRYSSPLPRAADDYIQGDFPATIRQVAAQEALPVFVMGHSLGGAILYGGAPYVHELLAGMIPIAAVYAFGGRQPLFRWAGRALARLPEREALLRLPLPIDWIGLGLSRVLRWIEHPLAELSPVTLWHPRTIAAEHLEPRVREGFERTTLGVLRQLVGWAASGRFVSADGRVDYAERWRRYGDMPLFVIAGSRDTLLPPSDAKVAYEEAPSTDKRFRVFGPREGGRHWGHIDLIQGDRAPAYVWPEILHWLEVHLEQPRTATSGGGP